jgi:hypothetical protein
MRDLQRELPNLRRSVAMDEQQELQSTFERCAVGTAHRLWECAERSLKPNIGCDALEAEDDLMTAAVRGAP